MDLTLSLVLRILLFASLLVCFSGWVNNGVARIRQGYQDYISGNYQKAEQSFQMARDQLPAVANFNLGITYCYHILII